MEEFEEVEAGVENYKLTTKSTLDLRIGRVYETNDILCVIKRIDKVEIKDGMISCDIIVQPLHKIR